MPATVVVGAQWGDEGKAKVIDWLVNQDSNLTTIVRYQGGCNAGHTVVHDGEQYKFHLIPSGILDPQKWCIIGPGTVVMPEVLEKELALLKDRGIDTGKLRISTRAHLTLPYHQQLDGLKESDFGDSKIGTTGRGIGPTYEDKAARLGLRVGDLLLSEADLKIRLEHILSQKNPILEKRYNLSPTTVESLMTWCKGFAERLGHYIEETEHRLWATLDANERLLLEGAQGTMLDLDYGTYPFVTSSSPVAGGSFIGAGIPPKSIDTAIGITKAYTTRVGEGPFPTELKDAVGDKIREEGHEFGTTTGRPRRCGWLDLVALRYACQINGFDALALTKLDVLDTFEEVGLCVAYKNTLTGEILKTFPSQTSLLDHIEPLYEMSPGWKQPLNQCRHWDELPPAAQQLIEKIEDTVKTPITLISVGPDRLETIMRQAPIKELTAGCV